MLMDAIHELIKIWPVFGVILSVGTGAGLWWLSKRFVSIENCTRCHRELNKRLLSADARMNSLEQLSNSILKMVEQTPTREDIHVLAVHLEGLNGKILALGVEIRGLRELEKGVQTQVATLTDYHLKR